LPLLLLQLAPQRLLHPLHRLLQVVPLCAVCCAASLAAAPAAPHQHLHHLPDQLLLLLLLLLQVMLCCGCASCCCQWLPCCVLLSVALYPAAAVHQRSDRWCNLQQKKHSRQQCGIVASSAVQCCFVQAAALRMLAIVMFAARIRAGRCS
jgi:hypothetical protein